MKKLFFITVLSIFSYASFSQFATYSFFTIDDDLNMNTYTLSLNSMDGITFWADFVAEGDLENYKLECDVEETEPSVYVIKFKSAPEGDYWQTGYMLEYWQYEDQPVLFIVEQGVGEVFTTFKEFKIENEELPEGRTLMGFELDE